MPVPNLDLIRDVADVDIDDADLAACEQAGYTFPVCPTKFPAC